MCYICSYWSSYTRYYNTASYNMPSCHVPHVETCVQPMNPKKKTVFDISKDVSHIYTCLKMLIIDTIYVLNGIYSLKFDLPMLYVVKHDDITYKLTVCLKERYDWVEEDWGGGGERDAGGLTNMFDECRYNGLAIRMLERKKREKKRPKTQQNEHKITS